MTMTRQNWEDAFLMSAAAILVMAGLWLFVSLLFLMAP